MKTQYELQFEREITAIILSKLGSIISPLEIFMDFHRNSNYYYDLFCDALLALSCGQSNEPLWITPSGRSYLAPARQSEFDLMVLTYEQIPEFENDLTDQLETALVFLHGLSAK